MKTVTIRHRIIFGIIVIVVACLIFLWMTHAPHHPQPHTSHLDRKPTQSATIQPQKSSPPPATSSIITNDLTDPRKKEIAMELVSSAENSSLDWRAQYSYIEDIGDGRGYTGGLIGFTSGTGDMLEVVRIYTQLNPDNPLSRYIPALQSVNGTNSHDGLDPGFTAAWKAAAKDPAFQTAQDRERDSVYFDPAIAQAKADGLHALGQFIYYDALVMHGPGDDRFSFGGIRTTALGHAHSPAQGGDEASYLNAYLDARLTAMRSESAHRETDRVDTEQRLFLKAGNLDLNPPLHWSTYGDNYTIQ